MSSSTTAPKITMSLTKQRVFDLPYVVIALALVYGCDWTSIEDRSCLHVLAAAITAFASFEILDFVGLGDKKPTAEEKAQRNKEIKAAWDALVASMVKAIKLARSFTGPIIMCVAALVMCIAAIVMVKTHGECTCDVGGGEQGLEVKNLNALGMGV